MQFFVSPETDKLPLPAFDGEYWVEVKRELSAGDAKKITLSALKRATPQRDAETDESSTAFEVDLTSAAFQKISVWLVDWNIPGPDGKTLDINTPKTKLDALKNLKSRVFDEIERVIDEHAKAVQEKKVPPT